jgi:hypothetical protein
VLGLEHGSIFPVLLQTQSSREIKTNEKIVAKLGRVLEKGFRHQ